MLSKDALKRLDWVFIYVFTLELLRVLFKILCFSFVCFLVFDLTNESIPVFNIAANILLTVIHKT